MNKKYIIISIVSVLVILIGVTIAYYSAVITGDKKKITINTKELQIVFHNGEEINEIEIEAPWETSKEFSVESKSLDIFYYNIVLQDLINGFTSNTLEYKITCTEGEGYSMDNFEPVPASPEKSDQILIEGIELQPKAIHTYKIEFKYDNKEDIDQSDDMGKTLSGSLYITKGEKKEILVADFYKKMEKQYPDTINIKRDNFNTTITEASAYYENGNFIESSITGASSLKNKVYYYTGALTNNWVSFADGSLRLLYGGPATDKGANENQYIGSTRTYNPTYNNTRYVGFKYGNASSLSNNRQNTENSPILGPDEDTHDTGNEVTLNGWYNQKIKTTYDSYISKTAVYCNDRGTNSYNATSTMYYAAYDRLNSNKRPSYKCGVKVNGTSYSGLYDSTQAEEDKFSGMNSKAKLTNPIGLITADEIVFAGGKYGTSLSSPYAYYYNNADGTKSATGSNYWWTMSPFYASGSGRAAVFRVYGSTSPGQLNGGNVDSTFAVRPVVSLKSCVLLSDSTGTTDDPFVVQTISEECARSDN